MKNIVVGITGASGSIYAKTIVEELLKIGVFVNLISTENGKKVFDYELCMELEKWVENLTFVYKNINFEKNDDMFSRLASGSNDFDAMLVIPCSMATLAEISNGFAKNLICRCSDVALKEGRKLIIVPRETPLNTIHLENMCKLSKMGAKIVPAMPGFYHHPETIDDIIKFLVGKVLNYLRIDNKLLEK